jgi:hypothetical protein
MYPHYLVSGYIATSATCRRNELLTNPEIQNISKAGNTSKFTEAGSCRREFK